MEARQDRTAIVTGAASGIGRGIAERFARMGLALGLVDVDENGLKETAKLVKERDIRVAHAVIDVSDPRVEQAIVDLELALGPVFVLANVAGVWTGGSVTEMTVEDWDRVMAVNAKGVFLCSRGVLPGMVQRRDGVIINIGSLAALKGTRRAGAYNPSKAAVIALTKNMALDFAPYGIRVNAICPGAVDGTGMDHAVRTFRGGYTEEYERWVRGLHPLGRLGTPEDVAGAAAYIASDDARWMTGSTLVIDGGCMTGY